MPLSDKQRERIVEVAKSWYGTPYRGWTCLRGVGADCGQLLKGVLVEAGHMKVVDVDIPANYSLRAALHTESKEYVGIVEKCMREISESEGSDGVYFTSSTAA